MKIILQIKLVKMLQLIKLDIKNVSKMQCSLLNNNSLPVTLIDKKAGIEENREIAHFHSVQKNELSTIRLSTIEQQIASDTF